MPSMKQIVVLLLLLLPFGCAKRQETADSYKTAESYQIVSHQAASGEWVIIRVNNENHSRIQITAVCDFYKWGEHEPVEGPDSCDLVVGDTLVPNRFPKDGQIFLDIWQLGDTLFITRGDGPGRVSQQFSVRSAQVME